MDLQHPVICIFGRPFSFFLTFFVYECGGGRGGARSLGSSHKSLFLMADINRGDKDR